MASDEGKIVSLYEKILRVNLFSKGDEGTEEGLLSLGS
jgi:hypothetical protein